jgi:hypothetical protein
MISLEARNLIRLLVEEYVSSLPSKEDIISKSARKIRSSDIPPPRIAGHVLPPINKWIQKNNQPQQTKAVIKKELSDEKIKDIVRKYSVTRSNCLDMLSSDKELRKELGLGDIHMKNSDYYKKIYRIVVNEAN